MPPVRLKAGVEPEACWEAAGLEGCEVLGRVGGWYVSRDIVAVAVEDGVGPVSVGFSLVLGGGRGRDCEGEDEDGREK